MLSDPQTTGHIMGLAAKEIERLQARVTALEAALEVRAWTEEEVNGMADAFIEAHAKHGHYESVFAVGAWLLRHRMKEAMSNE